MFPTLRRFLPSLLAASAFFAVAASAQNRVVAVGGAVTETVYALGAESRLVGCDTSSVYPEAATKLPQVGYARTLSAEGVLALKPDLILGTDETGPPAVVQQLRDSGVRIVLVKSADHSVLGTQAQVRAVAEALGLKDKGEAIAAKLGRDFAAVPKPAKTPRVLFLYARGGGTMNVAGRATAADAIIGLAGGVNAVDGYEGYKPLTAEAAISAAPDVILLPSRGMDSVGGLDGVLSQPGLAQTPAGKARRVVAMDDLLLLGFGPRAGEGALELAKRLSAATP